jgi:hypothetical protein
MKQQQQLPLVVAVQYSGPMEQILFTLGQFIPLCTVSIVKVHFVFCIVYLDVLQKHLYV